MHVYTAGLHVYNKMNEETNIKV